MFSRLRAALVRQLVHASGRRRFLLLCAGLALAGTVSAAYPVTAVVLPAALLAPRRWLPITWCTALGSALGATLLVLLFHHMGWVWVLEHYPQLASSAAWGKVMQGVSDHGVLALFLISATPLPQTPALIFMAIGRPEPLAIFVAMLGGKLLKYGAFAWGATRCPERLRQYFRRRWGLLDQG